MEQQQQAQPVLCEVCQTAVTVVPPPLPPQILNGGMASAAIMINGRGECPKCGAKYITQITGVQIALGFVHIKDPEEKRIVVPNMAMPRNLKVQ